MKELKEIVNKIERRRIVVDGEDVGRMKIRIKRKKRERNGRGSKLMKNVRVIRNGGSEDDEVKKGRMGGLDKRKENIGKVLERKDKEKVESEKKELEWENMKLGEINGDRVLKEKEDKVREEIEKIEWRKIGEIEKLRKGMF